MNPDWPLLYPNRYIVVHSNAVRFVLDDEETAIRTAIYMFGVDGPWDVHYIDPGIPVDIEPELTEAMEWDEVPTETWSP